MPHIRNSGFQVFFISVAGSTSLLNNGLLFVPDDILSVSDAAEFQATQNILEKGWQFEFRENEYEKALEYYQTILADVAGEPRELYKCSLWRIPIKGGEPEKLGLEMNYIANLSVHPDG